MTANNALHPQSDVDRFYLHRNEGGRGLLQVKVKLTVEKEKRALCDYIQNSTEEALKAVSKEHVLSVKGTKKDYRQEEIKKHRDTWQSKALRGQYLKRTLKEKWT